MKSAALLREELEEAAIALFRAPPKFGTFMSEEQKRACARRSNPLPKVLSEFLDFQEKWEIALQRPLFEVLPFRVELGDVAFYFNNEEAREWLFPFAHDAQGSAWASWLWDVQIPQAPVAFLDVTRRQPPRLVTDWIVQFFRDQAAHISGASEVERDFIRWTSEDARVLVLPPTAQVTEWPLPGFPDFPGWCREMMS